MAGEILSRINKIESNIEDSFTACQEKGASLPANRVSDNLPTTIRAIPVQEMPPERTEADLTASGATVTAPAGWYKQAASKAVSTATQATPSISVNSSGLITASATQSAGYVPAGTKSATKQLTQQAAKTVTPTKSEQTAVAAGVYTTGAVKVSKIPDSYIIPSGTKSITENGTHDVTAFASVNINVPTSGGNSSVTPGSYTSTVGDSIAHVDWTNVYNGTYKTLNGYWVQDSFSHGDFFQRVTSISLIPGTINARYIRTDIYNGIVYHIVVDNYEANSQWMDNHLLLPNDGSNYLAPGTWQWYYTT